MNSIVIDVVENGFIVNVFDGNGSACKKWVFEEAYCLAAFVHEWSEGTTEPKIKIEDL